MKKKIQIYKNLTRVETIEKELEFPEEAKYYSREDDGNWFPRGTILFAIIPTGKTSPRYVLVQVERDKQDSTDFVPHDDCKTEFFPKNHLRKTAFDIIENEWANDFDEITKEKFHELRDELLNKWREYEQIETDTGGSGDSSGS